MPCVHAGPGRTVSGAEAAPRVEVLNFWVHASQNVLRGLRTPNAMQTVLSVGRGARAGIRISNRAMPEELVAFGVDTENQS